MQSRLPDPFRLFVGKTLDTKSHRFVALETGSVFKCIFNSTGLCRKSMKLRPGLCFGRRP